MHLGNVQHLHKKESRRYLQGVPISLTQCVKVELPEDRHRADSQYITQYKTFSWKTDEFCCNFLGEVGSIFTSSLLKIAIGDPQYLSIQMKS